MQFQTHLIPPPGGGFIPPFTGWQAQANRMRQYRVSGKADATCKYSTPREVRLLPSEGVLPLSYPVLNLDSPEMYEDQFLALQEMREIASVALNP